MIEDDQIIEAMARASCRARGVDPDHCTIGSGFASAGGSTFTCHRRMWEDEAGPMRAAYRALREREAGK